MATYQEPSHWTPLLVERQIDPILLDDKRLEISQEMQVKSLAARRSAKNDYQWANAELVVVDEWAEKLYSAWLEIWDLQGYPRCHALYRAIFEVELRTLFATRYGCFKGEQQRRALIDRTRAGNNTTGGWFSREIDRLCAKWNRRVNVESRKSMYAAKREKATLTTVQSAGTRSFDALGTALEDQFRSVTSTFTWKQLEIRFRDVQAKATGKKVSATLSRTEWEVGTVNEEWTVGGDPVCGKEFEHLASIAARKLGCALSENAHKDWLGRVRQYLQRAELEHERSVAWRPNGGGIHFGLTYKSKTLHTERIAEMSAMFCMDLMARGIPESAVPPPSERSEALALQLGPRKIMRKVRKTKAQLHRRAVIFGAIQAGLKGKKYCAALDERKIRLPDDWKENGRPDTYTEAYKDKGLRKRIQDEKCRYREQFENVPAPEREAIIQGETGTRRTRH